MFCKMLIIMKLAFLSPPLIILLIGLYLIPLSNSFADKLAICLAWSLVYWWWLKYHAKWEICAINCWWLNLLNLSRSLLILVKVGTWGLLALGVVGLDFLLRLCTLERIVTLCLFYLERWIVKYIWRHMICSLYCL